MRWRRRRAAHWVSGGNYFAANDSATTAAGLFLKQAFVRLGAPPARGGHALRIGRVEFADGIETVPRRPTLVAVKRDRIAHRLLGPFGWSHVGRSIDAVHYTYDRAGRNATLLAGRVTQGAFNRNGWDQLAVTIGYTAATLRTGSAEDGAGGEVRLLAAACLDERKVIPTDNRALAVRQADRGDLTIGAIGVHMLQAARTPFGEIDALAWGAIQGGSWGVLAHRARAAALEFGWQPPLGAVPLGLQPWVRAGWNHWGGDRGAADAVHGTFFSMVPTPRLYARFPYYTPMNAEDVFASLLVRPRSTLSARLDVRRQRLVERNSLWYAGGGAFEHGTFGYAGRPSSGVRDLASLVDLSVDWRPRSRWTVSGYVALARGGPVVERIYPARSVARFIYVEMQYAR